MSSQTPQLWADVASSLLKCGQQDGHQDTALSALPLASSGSLAEMLTLALGPAFAAIWELRLTRRSLKRI